MSKRKARRSQSTSHGDPGHQTPAVTEGAEGASALSHVAEALPASDALATEGVASEVVTSDAHPFADAVDAEPAGAAAPDVETPDLEAPDAEAPGEAEAPRASMVVPSARAAEGTLEVPSKRAKRKRGRLQVSAPAGGSPGADAGESERDGGREAPSASAVSEADAGPSGDAVPDEPALGSTDTDTDGAPNDASLDARADDAEEPATAEAHPQPRLRVFPERARALAGDGDGTEGPALRTGDDEDDDDDRFATPISLEGIDPEDTETFLMGLLEALLFTSQQPLSLKELARSAGVDRPRAQELLARLSASYATRGICIEEIGGGFAMRSSPRYAPYVQKLLALRPVRLSRAQLETLAIIAYRQPVTKPEVDDIRGVDSGQVIKGLLERNLLKILGRKDEAGRPTLYGTTNEFLELLSLQSLKDLPTLREYTELSEESRQKFMEQTGEAVPNGATLMERAEPLWGPSSNTVEDEAGASATPDGEGPAAEATLGEAEPALASAADMGDADSTDLDGGEAEGVTLSDDDETLEPATHVTGRGGWHDEAPDSARRPSDEDEAPDSEPALGAVEDGPEQGDDLSASPSSDLDDE